MYLCNITGQQFDLNDEEKTRESGVRFGFNNRFRAICYVLTKLLYGKCEVLHRLKPNKNIRGIGMSDSAWSYFLAKKFNYINTFYHMPPYLDIYNNNHVKNYKELDFIVSSDVFEHISPYPSVKIAFDNVYKMLKDKGYFIFSVPFTDGEHKEHFPELYEYNIHKENDEFFLLNRTIDNRYQLFNNLCFHNGPGSVLEMRVFSKNSIIKFLQKSGFINIVFHEINADMNKYGIFWSKNNDDNSSVIISAQKG